MRIAHIITRMIVGGAQENTLLCCRDLIHTFGDDVLLLCGAEQGPEGTLLEDVKSSNIPLEIVPGLQRAVHPINDMLVYRRLKAILRHYQPDVVHTHSAKGGILGRLAAWHVKVPAVVHTVHGAPFHSYQHALSRTLSRWCETFAARRCHALVSVADAMTEQLVRTNVAPRDRFVTIYSGMDVTSFVNAAKHREVTRERLGYTPEHLVVGKVARLFHLKGHEYLIRAAEQLVPRYPQLRFLLVGDGILRTELQRMIQNAGLTDHVQFTGLVEPSRIPEYLAAMDLAVHTSLREGLARVLPQALLAGCPVISYDVDGAREVVIDGQTGFLLPPQSVDELANAIEQMVVNPDLRKRMAEEGRRLCEERFPHERMTEQLRHLYQQLLNQESNLGSVKAF